MSKVKIEGHGTGTGTFTVTTPSSNTDRTLTLPDSTGTLATTADTFNPDAAVTINESGADVDFRVESDGLTHALFVEGGNGRVGVNTDSPDYSFHMVGDRLMTENLSNGNTGIFMRVKNGGSQVGNATIRTNNNGDISIYQGTSSEALRATLKQSGGICFNSDTAAANALDDYEEGTWTGTFAVSSGSVVTNNSNNTGRYTRIGRSVHVQGVMVTASHSSPSGTLTLSGLPFACGADTDLSEEVYFYIGVNNIANNNGATNQPLMGYLGGGSQTITIYTSDGNNLGGAGNRVNNNGYFGFSFTYSA